MRLAFDGLAHYAEFGQGYELYKKRSKTGQYVDEATYRRIIKAYCRKLASRLCGDGIVDLPCGLGSIAACTLTRRPQYRGKQFVGFGAMDWKTGHRDGNIKAFGITFLPRREKHKNIRCYGFVANRQLFKKVKELYMKQECGWKPMDFNDEMI